MSGIEDIEVVAYVGCESRMTQGGHENGDEYLVFADIASDADKRYNCPLMTVAQHNRIVEQYQRDAERMREALAEAKYRIETGRVWNGTGWSFTGLNSMEQEKAVSIISAALNQQQYKVKS